MTILGRGDLSPPRRRRHPGRAATVIVVVALLAAGGYAAYRELHGGSSNEALAGPLPVCPRPSSPAASFPPGKLVVDNASLRPGLAAAVAHQLRHRGFSIGSVGNAAKLGKGVAAVRYSPDRIALARRTAAQISGATLVPVAGHGVTELDLAPRFRSLASRTAAHTSYLQLSGTTPSPSPTPTTGRTCRPRTGASHG